jgi:hypothetical protein
LNLRGKACKSKVNGPAYYDDTTNKHQIPYQIILLGEFGVAPFYLAKIVIH